MMKKCLYIVAAFVFITNAGFTDEPKQVQPKEQQEVKKEVSQEQQLATLTTSIEEVKKDQTEEAQDEKLAIAPVSTKELDDEKDSEEKESVLANAPESDEDAEEIKKDKEETLLAGCANGKCPYANINEDETSTVDGRSGATKPHKV
jgi:hypothetical protein